MANTTTIGTGRPWAAVLLAGALAAAVLLALGPTAGARAAQGPDLALNKTVYPKTVRVGEQQTFTVRVTNEGTARAEGVRMRDPLPSKVRFVRATTSRGVPGSCGIENRIVGCRLGALGVDRTVTVRIYVEPVVAASYTNRAYACFCSPGARNPEPDDSHNSHAASALVGARRP